MRVDNKRESGEVMIETLIVFTTTLFIIFAMMGFGILLCQQSMMKSIANEAATFLGDNYKYINENNDLDLQNFVVSEDDMKNTMLYRMTIKKNSVSRKNNVKANVKRYVEKRNKMTSFAPDEKIDTNVEWISDNIGRMHVQVTISQEYDFFLLGALKGAGVLNETPRFEAIANAECIDYTGYVSMVGTADYIARKAKSDAPNLTSSVSNISDTINTVIETMGKLKKTFKGLF